MIFFHNWENTSLLTKILRNLSFREKFLQKRKSQTFSIDFSLRFGSVVNWKRATYVSLIILKCSAILKFTHCKYITLSYQPYENLWKFSLLLFNVMIFIISILIQYAFTINKVVFFSVKKISKNYAYYSITILGLKIIYNNFTLYYTVSSPLVGNLFQMDELTKFYT